MTERRPSKSNKADRSIGKPKLVNGVIILQHEQEEETEETLESLQLQFEQKDGGVFATAPQDKLPDEKEEEEVAIVQTLGGIVSVGTGSNEIQHILDAGDEKAASAQVQKTREENNKRTEEAAVSAPPRMVNGIIVASSDSYSDIEHLLDADLKDESAKEEVSTRKIEVTESKAGEQSELDQLLGTSDTKDES